jgi:hypothetical protein
MTILIYLWDTSLEAVSKKHLTPKSSVANRFKMLAYRGKMPLPLLAMIRGSGFQPRIMDVICYF